MNSKGKTSGKASMKKTLLAILVCVVLILQTAPSYQAENSPSAQTDGEEVSLSVQQRASASASSSQAAAGSDMIPSGSGTAASSDGAAQQGSSGRISGSASAQDEKESGGSSADSSSSDSGAVSGKPAGDDASQEGADNGNSSSDSAPSDSASSDSAAPDSASADGTSSSAVSPSSPASTDFSDTNHTGKESMLPSGTASSDAASSDAASPDASSSDASASDSALPDNVPSEDASSAEEEDSVEEDAAEENSLLADNTALDITDTSYITAASISYITPASGSQQRTVTPITTGTVIPEGTTGFEITIRYANVPSHDLKNSHNSQISYTLPSVFANAAINGSADIHDDSTPPQTVGTMSATGNQVLLTFTEQHLNEGDENSTVSGFFTVDCTLASGQPTENPLTVKIGNTEVTLTFEQHETAETGELTAEKSNARYIAVRDSSGNPSGTVGYLEYTLTVKTGADAMPDVRVEDVLSTTDNSPFVDGYFVAGTLSAGSQGETGDQSGTGEQGGTGGSSVSLPDSESAEPLADGSQVTLPDGNGTVSIKGSKPGSMTWIIGDMPANETRTLTYRIKLNRNFVGLAGKYSQNNRTTNLTIANTATPYSKTYPHTSARTSYTPTVSASVKKTAGTLVDNAAAGTITIPYEVEIAASADNPWPLRNVKIADNLSRSYDSKNTSTPAADRTALCQYAKFQDFKVWRVETGGTRTDVTSTVAPNGISNQANSPYDASNQYNPRYDIYIGDVAPGVTHVLTYNLVISKQLFTTRSGSWTVGNNVTVRTNDQTQNRYGGNQSIGSGQTSQVIGTQVWDRKLDGVVLDNAITQQPTGSGQEAVTIPAGAIRYQVIVNESGQWDLSSATLADELEKGKSKKHLKYIGYLQVDYYAEPGITYDTSSDGSVTIPESGAVLSTLQGKTPSGTAYIDIADQTSFSFTPSSSGLNLTSSGSPAGSSSGEGSGGSGSSHGAFLLTYYAVPAETGNMMQFTGTNDFFVSGTVTGPGGGPTYTADTPIGVRTSQIFQGNFSFSASKQAWYYDFADRDDQKAYAYWVIEGTGTGVPQGLSLKDTPGSNVGAPELVGVYIGALPESTQGSSGGSSGSSSIPGTFSDIRSYTSAISGSSSLKTLAAGTDYTWDDTDKAVTFLQTTEFTSVENEKLYVIIRTPISLSVTDAQKRNTYTLSNSLSLKEEGEEYRSANTASLYVNGGSSAFKQLGEVFSVDSDKTITQITAGQTGSGQSGSVLLTDQVSDPGVYVEWRIKINYDAVLNGTYRVADSLPEGLKAVYVRYFWIHNSLTSSPPTMPAISGLGDGWTDIGNGLDSGGASHEAHAYYQSSTGQILFDVGNLRSANGPASSQSSFESVVRDQYALEVQLVAKVTDPDALAGVSKTYVNRITLRQGDTLVNQDSSSVTVKKDSISKERGDVSGTTVRFTITANPLGADLAGGASAITLVDELQDPLAFDLSTLRITDASGSDATGSVLVQDGGRTEDGTGTRLLFTIPNRTKLTISYSAVLYAQANTTFNIRNKAFWQGYENAAVSSNLDRYFYKVNAGSSTTHRASITVTKRNRENLSDVLPDAVFQLAKAEWTDEDGWKISSSSDPRIQSASTDENGVAEFDNLDFNTPYILAEKSAPAGFETDSSTQVIVIAQDDGTGGISVHYPDSVQQYASHGATVQYEGYQFRTSVYDTPRKISVTVSKIWQDDDNKEETRPKTITVRLYANDVEVDSAVLSEENQWNSHTFTDLPTYENGSSITYTIKEDSVTDYTASCSAEDSGEGQSAGDQSAGDQSAEGQTAGVGADGLHFTVTNTYTPADISICVKKVWDDQGNRAEIRPEKITVHLYADGEDTGKSAELNEEGQWSSTFTNLEACRDGRRIEYTIAEDTAQGYETPVITGSAEDGFIITNTITPQSETRQSETKQSETKQSETKQSETRQSEKTPSETKQSETKQSGSEQTETPQSETQSETAAPETETKKTEKKKESEKKADGKTSTEKQTDKTSAKTGDASRIRLYLLLLLLSGMAVLLTAAAAMLQRKNRS